MIRLGYNQRRVTSIRKEEILPFETRETQLRFRKSGEASWNTVTGVAMNNPDTDRIVHTVNVSGLESDSVYEFQLPSIRTGAVYLTWADDPTHSIVVHWHTFNPFPSFGFLSGFSNEIHKFKTMPERLNESIKFAQVTDTHGGGWNHDIFSHIGSIGDVRGIIHSGDMATGNGGELTPRTWYTFFNALMNAKNADGTIIPIVPALGNHETWGGGSGFHFSDGRTGRKPNFETHERGDTEWYYTFFPSFIEQGYALHEFGDYMSLWQLDPGISTRLDGEQQDWLADTMEQSTSVHRLVSMHYSPYPTGRRDFDIAYSKIPRDLYCPIWEPHKPLVLVGHEHVWSKTVPIKDGAEHPDGTVYIGAGPSGNQIQPGRNPATKWWIERARAEQFTRFNFEKDINNQEYREPHEDDGTKFDVNEVNNWWLIDIRNDRRIMTAYDLNQDVIHSFEQGV